MLLAVFLRMRDRDDKVDVIRFNDGCTLVLGPVGRLQTTRGPRSQSKYPLETVETPMMMAGGVGSEVLRSID